MSVSTDSKKRKPESQEDAPQGPRKAKHNFRGDKNKGNKQSGCAPPTSISSRRETEQLCGGVETYYERSFILSIVAKGYRLRFTSPPLLRQTPWEIRSLQDPLETLGMREQITLMLQKNAITEVPPDSPGFYSNVFLVRKASGGWGPFIDLKNLNAHIYVPHFRMFTTSSVLCSVEKLRLQDRSAGCVLSRTDSSKQQEVPQVRLRKQGVPVSSASFVSKHSPSSFYLFGAHGDSIPAPPRGFGDTISRRLVSSPPRPPNLVTPSGSADSYARPGWLHSESKEIRAGPYSGSPVPRNSLASGPRESSTPRVQSLGDSRLHAPSILPQGTKLFSSGHSIGPQVLSLWVVCT